MARSNRTLIISGFAIAGLAGAVALFNSGPSAEQIAAAAPAPPSGVVAPASEVSLFGPSYEEMTWAQKAEHDLSRARRESVPLCKAEIERKEAAAREEARLKNERNRALGNGIVSHRADVLQLCVELLGELRAAGLSAVIDPRAPGGVASGSAHITEWPPDNRYR